MKAAEKQKMEFEKVSLGKGLFYWTWRDIHFMPYGWLDKNDLKTLPKPFFLDEINPDCKIGFESYETGAVTNIIALPKSFEELNLDSGLRKDLRRIEKKNSDAEIRLNEKNALEKSRHWFLELWKEEKKDFERRMHLWKEKAYTLSLYSGSELLGVHIAIENPEKATIYYLGCWWNRKHSNRSVPIFLLKKDIERAIRKGMKHYDLGIGDESYKKKWGVVEKRTKYYAVLTRDLAKELGVKEFIEIKK